MAIDSAEKRKSISGIQTITVVGVTNHATPDSGWRAEAGWNYSGMAYLARLYGRQTLIIPYRDKVVEDLYFVDVDEDLSFKERKHGKSTLLSG